jgi:hypothetical protein
VVISEVGNYHYSLRNNPEEHIFQVTSVFYSVFVKIFVLISNTHRAQPSIINIFPVLSHIIYFICGMFG